MVRTSLAYPKIPGSSHSPDEQCIAFEKYDGTNLHWVWEQELGWYAFGMRRHRYDFDEQGIADFHAKHAGFQEAPQIFEREFARQLEVLFEEHENYQSTEITVFTEFFGPQSFAGLHKNNDPKELILFDVQTEQGLLSPAQLLSDFHELPIAKVIYQGRLTGKFIHEVREGKYSVSEGVVCKGGEGDRLWMCKIKTNAYLKKLQEAFAENWEDYWE